MRATTEKWGKKKKKKNERERKKCEEGIGEKQQNHVIKVGPGTEFVVLRHQFETRSNYILLNKFFFCVMEKLSNIFQTNYRNISTTHHP